MYYVFYARCQMIDVNGNYSKMLQTSKVLSSKLKLRKSHKSLLNS